MVCPERLNMSEAENRKIREWQKDVVRSIADEDSVASHRASRPLSNSPPPRYYPHTVRPEPSSHPIVVNQIVTNTPVVVTRVKAPEVKPSDEISTKAMLGTVVGATAGAFIAYAMVKGDSGSQQISQAKEPVTYRRIDAPLEYSVGQPKHTSYLPIQESYPHHGSLVSDRSRVRNIGPPPTKVATHASTTSHSRISSERNTQSRRLPPQDGPIIMIDREKDTPRSYAPSAPRQASLSQHSPPVTELRTTRHTPPPPARSQASRYSRASSATVRESPKVPREEPREIPLPSVAPYDSISQVSTKRSGTSGKSKHHHSSHHRRSRSAHGSEKEYVSDGGSRTRGKHSVGEMVDDVTRIIRGTSIRGSDRRQRRG